jgi:RNA polymerase sigma factor (sigma-70 family)
MAFGIGKRKGTAAAGLHAVSDEALMAGVAAGHEPALHEFVDRFERRVYGAAIAITRDPALADEITQDTFMRVWRRAESFDPRRGTVIGWVMRITRNIAVDALRVRRPTAVDPMDLVGVHDEAPGPASVNRVTTEVRELLGSLPLEQARALLMAGFYGYTAAEIGEMEGVPLGTAKTRIRLGLDKLRTELHELAEEPR